MFYLTETDPRGAMGLGGFAQTPLGTNSNYLAAIDYRTGKIAWRHNYPPINGAAGNGVLTTAGGLVFAGDISGNFVAYDAKDGRFQCAADLRDRRPAARPRGRGRRAVCVRAAGMIVPSSGDWTSAAARSSFGASAV
jgi:hypothetical protein